MDDEPHGRSIHRLNRIIRWSIAAFFAGFGAMALAPFLPQSAIGNAVALAAVATMFLSVIALVGTIIIRDIKDRKRHRWQFSIRSLLIVIAALAFMLGSLMLAIRG